MEVSKNTFNNQEQRKIIGKMGGGGGIGAAIVLGGALATTALASFFIVGKKERSSGKNRGLHQQIPPPELRNEHDEANKGLDRCCTETTEEVESVKDQKLNLDEKPGIEINGKTPTDVEKSEYIIKDEKILPSEHEAKIESTEEDINKISKGREYFQQVDIDREMMRGKQDGDGLVNMEMNHEETVDEMQTRSDENNFNQEEIVLAAVHKALEEVQFNQINHGPAKGDYNDRYEMRSEKNIEKEVDDHNNDNESHHIDEMDADVNNSGNDHIDQLEAEKEQETEVATHNDEMEAENNNPSMKVNNVDQEKETNIVSDEDSEDPKEIPQPLMTDDSPVIEENKDIINNDDKKKDATIVEENHNDHHEKTENGSNEVEDITKEDEITESGQEDKVKNIEDEKKMDQAADEEILPEKHEANQSEIEEEVPCEENKEEKGNACIINQTLENAQFEMLKEKPVSFIKPDDVTNKGIENSSETYEIDNEAPGDDDADETDSSDEDEVEEESSKLTRDSSTESNSAPVLPAEQLEEPTIELEQEKLINQVLTGKTGEDKITSKVKSAADGILQKGPENFIVMTDSNVESLKTNMEKFVVEMGLIKDHMKNTTRKRILIVLTSVLLSASCSWLFDISFVKLCLIMFMTVVLSEIRGY